MKTRPPSDSARTTVRLPDDLHRRAKLAAAWSGRKLQDLIAEAVESYLPSIEAAMEKGPSSSTRGTAYRTE